MFTAGAIDGDKLYFSSEYLNGLYCFDIRNGFTTFISHFPEESLHQEKLHVRCIVADGKILFIPGVGGNKVHILNLLDMQICSVKIKEMRGWNGHAIQEGNYVWLIPYTWDTNNCIGRIDIRTMEFENVFTQEDRFLIRRLVQGEKYITFADGYSSYIVSVDLTNGKVRKEDSGIKYMQGLFQVYNDYWISHMDSATIYIWDKKGFVKEEISNSEGNQGGGFGNVIVFSDEVFLLPISGNLISTYNLSTKHWNTILCKKEHKFATFGTYEDIIVCFPTVGNELLLIDTNTKIVKEVAINRNNDDRKTDYIKEKGVIPENKLFSLNSFIEEVTEIPC